MTDNFTSVSQEGLVKDHFQENAKQWQLMYTRKDLHSRIIQERFEYALHFIDSFELPEHSRALDLGCGAGLLSMELLKRKYSVVGFDVSQKMIELARRNCADFASEGRAKFLVDSAEEMDFENQSFDVVTALGLIEYLRWDHWVLSEIHRILKPDGFLVVSIPNSLRLSNLTDPIRIASKIKRKAESVFTRLIGKIFGRRAGELVMRLISRYLHRGDDESAGKQFERRLYRPSLFDRMLRDHGYIILETACHGYGPFVGLGSFNRLSLALNAVLRKILGVGRFDRATRVGNNYIVLCQKVESATFEEKLRTSDIDRVTRDFSAANKDTLGRLAAWTAKHQELTSLWLEKREIDIPGDGSVLVLSPHPDDEIIGCGGTLLNYLDRGAKVTVIQLTDGSDTKALANSLEEVKKTIRLEEAERISQMMGFSELILWKEIAHSLEPTTENVKRLAELLRRLRPSTVFVPFVNDLHPDHVAANKILAQSLIEADAGLEKTQIISYEVWSLVPVNTYSIVDSQFVKKAAALHKYRTAMKVVDYIAFCESLNSYHACKTLSRMGYVEAFFACCAADYIKLMERCL